MLLSLSARMLKPAVPFLLTISVCSGQRRSLNEPVSSGEVFPEQWLDQARDHLDATNTARWRQRFWQNFQLYRGEGLAFLMLGGEVEANPNLMGLGKLLDGKVYQWYKWAQENGAAMFVLEHYGQVLRPEQTYRGSEHGELEVPQLQTGTGGR